MFLTVSITVNQPALNKSNPHVIWPAYLPLSSAPPPPSHHHHQEEDVVRLLHSLSCAKYQILAKEPAGKTINKNDKFK